MDGLLLGDELTFIEPANVNGGWWLLVVALAIVLACLVYRYETPTLPIWKRIGLASCRAAALCLLGWMWFGWRTVRTPAERQEIVVIVDGTGSMAAEDETPNSSGKPSSRWNAAGEAITRHNRELWERLSSDFRLAWTVCPAESSLARGEFGELTTQLQQQPTFAATSPLGRSLLTALDQQRGRPTAAVIFFTDGNVTDGPTLLSAAGQFRSRMLPLYIVGTGRATPTLDWQVADVRVERQAFVGETLRFQVRVIATGAEQPAKLQLIAANDGRLLAETTLDPTRPQQEAVLLHRPETPGDIGYQIKIEPPLGEVNTANNVQRRQVHVRPFAAKVLLAWGYPSYEYRYLKSVLERDLGKSPAAAGENKAELRVFLQEADPEFAAADRTAIRDFPLTRDELDIYDAIILGDLNLRALGPTTLANLEAFVSERGGGLAIVAGDRFGFAQFAESPLVECLPFELTGDAVSPGNNLPFRIRPSALGFAIPFLQLADTPVENAAVWEQLPPAYWRLAIDKTKPGVRVLAEALAADGSQRTPVITSHFLGAGQVLFHGTDELHRWRFRRGDVFFGRYWQQAIRTLARRENAEQRQEFTSDRPLYQSGEAVELQLRFHDPRQAPAVDDGVAVQVETAGIAPWRLALVRDRLERGTFRGTIADLSPGDYQARVVTPAPGESVRFSVAAPVVENIGLPLNAAACREAAELTGGVYRPLAQLPELLSVLPPPRMVPAAASSSRSLWNSPWLALLLVALLGGEWWWRQRLGMV